MSDEIDLKETVELEIETVENSYNPYGRDMVEVGVAGAEHSDADFPREGQAWGLMNSTLRAIALDDYLGSMEFIGIYDGAYPCVVRNDGYGVRIQELEDASLDEILDEHKDQLVWVWEGPP